MTVYRPRISIFLFFAFLFAAVPSLASAAEARLLGAYRAANRNVMLCRLPADRGRFSEGLREEAPGKSWITLRFDGDRTARVDEENCLGEEAFDRIVVSAGKKSSGTFQITIYPRRTHWMRARLWSKQNLGLHIGIAAGNELLWHSTLKDSFDYQYETSAWKEHELRLFLRNFDSISDVSAKEREEDYFEWLKKSAEKASDRKEQLRAASILLSRKRFDDAEAVLVPLVKKRGETFVQASVLLGKAYLGKKETNAAIHVYRKLVQSDAGSWPYRRELSELYEKQGNQRMALAELQELLRMQELKNTNCELEKQLLQIKHSKMPTVMKNKLTSDLEAQLGENYKLLGR